MNGRHGAQPRFEDLTETTGLGISREAADMMYTRYRYAADLATGKRVLELGCGAGQGFRLVGAAASLLVGADYSTALLELARHHYGRAFPLTRLSADGLPFSDASFDLVLFFEASYYVKNMAQGFRELARVLRTGGTVVFVNANPERADFIRSPHSVHYHTGDEFRAALGAAGFSVSVAGAFPTASELAGESAGVRRHLSALARRILEASGLVPRTLRGRARLKRLMYGKLLDVPPELTQGFATAAPQTPLGAGPATGFKVIYVTARKPS